MVLDITPLARAVARLEEGLSVYRRDTTQALIRDGLVQRFEFTYEIAHKLLKRYLESVAASPEQYDSMAFQDLIRSGNEQGLLRGDWPTWKVYRDMRARTSRTYDEATAQQAVAGIPDFLDEARHLCAELQRRSGS